MSTGRPFLVVFPREIRDQIYTFVLASPSGTVSLSPWTLAVERSLSLLRTCKQVHRECKDIIWAHSKLTVRNDRNTELFQHLTRSAKLAEAGWVQNIGISLELLDRDELEWIRSALPAFTRDGWSKSTRTIILTAKFDRPEDLGEFEDLVRLRGEDGPNIDGRLYYDEMWYKELVIRSAWPPFAHWGKYKWLRQMLMDSSNLDSLLLEMHDIVGGELWVDGRLCFQDHARLVDDIKLDPKDGQIIMSFNQAGK